MKTDSGKPVSPECFDVADMTLESAAMTARSLWAAVMAEAILDLRSGKFPALKLWFSSDEMRPRSFAWICSLLDWEPGRVRARILQRDGRRIQIAGKALPGRRYVISRR